MSDAPMHGSVIPEALSSDVNRSRSDEQRLRNLEACVDELRAGDLAGQLLKVQADLLGLRNALAQGLAIAMRSGFNWKDALRMVERWVRPSVKAGEPGQLPAAASRRA